MRVFLSIYSDIGNCRFEDLQKKEDQVIEFIQLWVGMKPAARALVQDGVIPGFVLLNFPVNRHIRSDFPQVFVVSARSATSDDDFYRRKIVTARFYAEHYLPRSSGHFSSIRPGSGTIMALDEEQF